jgi:phosphopentomutase
MSFRRVIWIVLDSVGIGEMPDAAEYGDAGSDTLGHIAQSRKLHLNNLCRLGLGNIRPLDRLLPDAAPIGAYGRCSLASPGKDTTTGHWEMAGIHMVKPFPVYPHGFPPEVMEEFERRIGRATLGNKAASGTEILEELGEEHMRTGSPIIYTSADSVFQVAAHEEVIPLYELYKICETAREILRGKHEVGRVIARPFLGSPGAFTRTPNRHDYAVPPPKGMLLDRLKEQGVEVFAVGKIFDVFMGDWRLREDQVQRRRHGKDAPGHGLARPGDDFCKSRRFRSALWAPQRRGRLRPCPGSSRRLAAIA